MTRWLPLALLAVVLLLPFGLRLALVSRADDDAGDVDPTPLVIVTPHNVDIRVEFARAFDAWHRRKHGVGVKLVYLNPGGTNDVTRLLAARYKLWQRPDGTLPDDAYVDVDLAWGGGDYFFGRELGRLLPTPKGERVGVLQPVDLPAGLLEQAFPEPALAGVRLYDDNKTGAPRWVGVCLSAFGIVYSPAAYRDLGLPPPRTWADLADPKLNGFVALADPTRSGSIASTYLTITQRAMADAEVAFFAARPGEDGAALKKTPAYAQAVADGWKNGLRQLTLIAANARYFTDSASQVPKDVSTADAACGMAIDFYGRTYQEIVGPDRVTFVAPAAATAITPDPIAVLHGVKGQKRVLANRLVEFLLSREGQLLWVKRAGTPDGPRDRALRRPPIRRDVYAEDKREWSDAVDPFASAGNFNQRAEWMNLMTATRPVWAAAWIDTREALRSAYQTVLALPPGARRDELRFELSDVPCAMADVAADDAEARKRTGSDLQLWQARRRVEWARAFRAHYERVEAKAHGG